MPANQLLTRFAQLKAEDEQGIGELARDILAEAREAPHAAVRAFSQEGVLSKRAMYILAELEDAAIVPLSSMDQAASVQKVIWSLRTVGLQLASLREQTAKRIDAKLSDTRVVRPVEPDGHGVRVCDEAFLQLRRLLKPEAREEAYVAGLREFLAKDPAGKDKDIQKARKSASWLALLKGEY